MLWEQFSTRKTQNGDEEKIGCGELSCGLLSTRWQAETNRLIAFVLGGKGKLGSPLPFPCFQWLITQLYKKGVEKVPYAKT